jgi:probable rRNA maturation factor
MAEGDQGRAGLRVLVTDERGRRLSAAGLSRWLRRVAPARVGGSVSVAIVSDQRVRTLNRTYRRVNRATDVLSFPAEIRPRERLAFPVPTLEAGFLGDIVIARGVARRQAREAGHSELTEFRVLALHGLLHLVGYDHERDGGEMRRIERRLRHKGGLGQGLIERRSVADPPERGIARDVKRGGRDAARRGR